MRFSLPKLIGLRQSFYQGYVDNYVYSFAHNLGRIRGLNTTTKLSPDHRPTLR